MKVLKGGLYIGAAMLGLLQGGVVYAVDNPIDAPLHGPLAQHAGIYYGLGGETNVQLLVSSNLVNWSVAAATLPEGAAEAVELHSLQGRLFLYTPDSIFAVPPAGKLRFDRLSSAQLNGEHLRLFQDESGTVLSLLRGPGSRGGGEIGIRPCDTPWKAVRKPKRMLDGRSTKWDSLENAELGEPEMLKYRNQYYLLYGVNRPDPRTGLREIGMVMNKNFLRFENEERLQESVLTRNTERLMRAYKAVLPSGEFLAWDARYTTKRPAPGWERPGPNPPGWRSDEGGFGSPDEIGGNRLHSCRTEWTQGSIWIRREFDLQEDIPQTPVLKIRHEAAATVYLNGKRVYAMVKPSVTYRHVDLSKTAKGLFRPGKNVLAVHAVAHPGAASRFIDFGLYDAGDAPVEPIVCNIDDPRVVNGPNGFEKWMSYRAHWNGRPGYGLDRLFFINNELMVDGPTTSNTPGYHPPPVPPTFADTFSTNTWADNWKVEGRSWSVTNGILRQADTRGTAQLLLRHPSAENYLFETGIRLPSKGRGKAGVVAWSNGKRSLVITINPASGTWTYQFEGGGAAPKRLRLPSGIELADSPPGIKSAAPFHRLRVEKNGGYFEVLLDGVRLTAGEPIRCDLKAAGVPGLYCNAMAAEFDDVLYTIGWDEHNEYITGWGQARDGSKPGGDWKHTKQGGLRQRRHSDPGLAFKGDLLRQYEFTVNARTDELEDDSRKSYGVFPVFVDRNNYLKASILPHDRTLVVTGKRNGRELKPITAALQCRVPVRPVLDYEASQPSTASWIFPLRSKSIISGLDIRWLEGEYENLEETFFIPSEEMQFRFAELDEDRDPKVWEKVARFKEADQPKPIPQKPGILNPISLREETANYVGLDIFSTASAAPVLSLAGDFLRWLLPGDIIDPENEIMGRSLSNRVDENPARPQETLVRVEVESSYFFRCVKLKDRVIIELNGRPMLTIPGEWPPSQVGLVTERQSCYFNGMSLMHIPEE